MAGLQVVGLGGAVVDIIICPKDMPTWERNTSVEYLGLQGGGPVGTALVAASRLGARVGYVGLRGSDDLGDWKAKSLKNEGVEISHMLVHEQPERQIALVFVDVSTGERVFGAVHELRRSFVLRPEQLDREYITSAEYLHLDGQHRDAALQAAKWMREAGKTVVLDAAKVTPGPSHRRPDPELIQYVDILIAGSDFVPTLTGEKDIWEAGRAALRFGPRIVVQTEGIDGAFTVTADDQFHTPAFRVDVVDTTGAGDVFHGAYIVGLLNGWDLRRVTLFASAVSAIKCTRLGGRAGIPRFDEVISFLRERCPEVGFQPTTAVAR